MAKLQIIRSFSDDSVFLDAHPGSDSVAQICRSFSGGDDALFQDDEAAFQKAESFVPVPIPTICRSIPEDSFRALVQRHVSGSAALTINKTEELSSLPEMSVTITVMPEVPGLPTLKPLPPPFKALPKGRGQVLRRSLILIGKEVFNPDVAIANAAELLVGAAEIYFNKKLICSALIAPGSLLVIFSGSLLIGWIRRGKLGFSLPGVIEMGAVASTAFFGQWINAFGVEDGTKLAMKLLFSNAIRCLKKGLTGLLEKEGFNWVAGERERAEPVLPI